MAGERNREKDQRRADSKQKQKCWYGEKCTRKDCWFRHEETEREKKSDRATTKDERQKEPKDKTEGNHFLEERVAQIAEMLLVQIKKKDKEGMSNQGPRRQNYRKFY